MCIIMSIVDCHVSSLRLNGYNNILEWIDDDDNIYIGRFMRLNIKNQGRISIPSSIFANKFKVIDDNIDDVLKSYEEWLIKKLNSDEAFKLKFIELKNKNLGCWCHPKPCHGNIIQKVLIKY